jgi:hypothetical protein
VLRIAQFIPVAAVLLACSAERPTPVELCSAILERKLPGAEVVAIVPQPPDRLDITYAAPDAEGHLTCEVERSDLGGPRLRAATLDGRPLSDTELVVVNANLLLDELYWIGKPSG